MAEKEMLAKKEDYLTAGIHIGMKSCTPYMKQFVFKTREDGLCVFNLSKVDERLGTAANFLKNYKSILAVSRKDSSAQALQAFAKAVGGKAITGRFSPGTLTNPSYRDFYEPDVLVVVDPLVDEQSVKEANKKRIPVVAFCDTFNMAKSIDLCLPINNNGRKAVALAFWIIASEIAKSKGQPALKKEDFGLEEEAKPKPAKPRTLADEVREAAEKEVAEETQLKTHSRLDSAGQVGQLNQGSASPAEKARPLASHGPSGQPEEARLLGKKQQGSLDSAGKAATGGASSPTEEKKPKKKEEKQNQEEPKPAEKSDSSSEAGEARPLGKRDSSGQSGEGLE